MLLFTTGRSWTSFKSVHVSLFPCLSPYLVNNEAFSEYTALHVIVLPNGGQSVPSYLPLPPKNLEIFEDLNAVNHILCTLHISWHSLGVKQMFDG